MYVLIVKIDIARGKKLILLLLFNNL